MSLIILCALTFCAGYLMCTYKERGQGFSDLVSTIVDDNCQETYPLLSEKVRVMFLGKYNDHAVLAKGNVWIPDAKLSKKFATVLGEEVNQFLYLKKKKKKIVLNAL